MTVLFMLISVNADSLAVGFSYGMRRVRIPALSAAVISAFSVIYSFLAIQAGTYISGIIEENTCRILGAVLLAFIGVLVTANAFRENKKPQPMPKEPGKILSLAVKSLGISVSVVRDPAICDFDSSNRIELHEAVCLGFALSADAVGVGIGCSMSGITHPMIPIFIGASQLILLHTGIALGSRLSHRVQISRRLCGAASGILLIFISLLRLYM